MVGPLADLTVDSTSGPRWSLALDLLELGEGVVRLRDLMFFSDPATDEVSRRLHVEIACPVDPKTSAEANRRRMEAMANRDLANARQVVEDVCTADCRFAALVARSEVLYEYAYDYGMGRIDVAIARDTGPFSWK